MVKIQEIRELIRLVDQSSIDEFKYENEGIKLVMRKSQPVEVQSKVGQTQKEQEVIEQSTTLQPVSAGTTVAQTEAVVEPVQEKSEQESPKQVEDENLHQITSPMVGTFYQAPAPDAEPYVKVGDKVKNDTVVCIVEAMKLFNEIEAEVEGEIVEVLVQDGQLVEFGQPLFLVKVN